MGDRNGQQRYEPAHVRSTHVVRRVQLQPRDAVPPSWPAVARRQLEARLHAAALGYAGSILGVALVTVAIGLILREHVRITNISMIYLLPVLFLAAVFGRGPAVLASALAFLAFDFFFVPPVHTFQVYDPTEWSSLSLLLVTALVTGQLTATLRARAREAQLRQQETGTLYGLAQLIAAGSDLDTLLRRMAERVVDVFAPVGVEACTILLPGEDGRAVERTCAPPAGQAVAALSLRMQGRAYLVDEVLKHGAPLGPGAPLAPAAADGEDPVAVFYLPLRSGGRIVGALGIAGKPGIRALVATGKLEAHADGGGGGSSGSLLSLFAAFRDQISLAVERATLQEAAVHAEALRESDRLKDALLGSVSHDLRTPLAAIKATTSSLLQPGMQWSETERRDLIASIDESVDRLARLVSNLLDLSRLEAGVAAPHKDWHLLGEVVATALDRMELAGQLRDRKVSVEIPPDLPLVLIDHEQIEQVITNLIDNALKYSPVEAQVRLAASVRPEAAELEVRVSDEGVGIPVAELDAVFGKFYRVQRVQLPWAGARPSAGTGLGLAICQAIIRAHDGRIWAESRQGAGTTIVFTLPIPTDWPQGELPEVGADPARGSDAGGDSQAGRAQTSEVA
jgi:two-component system sensor histidine kinase KdpD